MSRQDKATTERHTRLLREMVKRPENKLCADCKRNDPRWASWNIGVFMCIRCSGVHRSMGTHISKVKSVDLDVWTPEQMQSIQKWGNRRANLYWEAHLKSGHVPPEHKVESFIRSKYESRRWAMEGQPPSDPSVLEQDDEGMEPVDDGAQAAGQEPLAGSSGTAAVAAVSVQGSSNGGAFPLRSTALMSSNRGQQAPVKAAPKSPPPPANPPPPQDDLFSLDFHAAPTSATSSSGRAPSKDMKNDIMSLFSSPAPTAPSIPNSTSAWGGSQAWGAPQQAAALPTEGDPWGTFTSASPSTNATSQSFFGNFGSSTSHPQQNTMSSVFTTSQNVWQSPAAPQALGGTNVWASAPASQPAAKKDDVFGDLWK